MGTIVRKETRKRGFFGWVFLILFILFNLMMLLWLVAGMINISSAVPSSEAGQAGHAIGTVIGAGFILFIWAVGAVILGLFALLTRGRKTIVEETTV